jgi:NAD(P)-dependent dehydrogenase (short-subunit alcohol dehydrogenase family)
MNEKIALVTGGSSGIGRKIAEMFASRGIKVAIADINPKGGAETIEAISRSNGKAIYLNCDVSNPKDVQGMISELIKYYGRIDYAVNNAGIGTGRGRLHEQSDEAWQQMNDINLKGVWLCMKYEIPHMLTQGQGSIVNISSIGGLAGFVWNAIYSATKHGVIGLTKSAAIQYAKDNIRINAVCPGVIDAGITGGSPDKFKTWAKERKPMGRFGSAEEVAEACVWLCSEKASFITGHSLPVDGGWMSE